MHRSIRILGLVATLVSGTACSPPAEPPAPAPVATPSPPPLEDDPDYAKGREFARNTPLTGAEDCEGSPAFQKGCVTYYATNVLRSENGSVTTAECQQKVNENYDHRFDPGNPGRRGGKWQREQEHCGQIDMHIAQGFIIPAYDYQEKLLVRLQSGETLAPQEIETVARNTAQMAKFIDVPYKAAYLDRNQEFLARIEDRYQAPPSAVPSMSCDEFREAMAALKKRDEDRVAEMQSLKREDGVVTNGRRHEEINQSRIAALWETQHLFEIGQAADCF